MTAYSTPALPKFDEMVKKNKVVVFMKGVPEQPMCGFSNAVVQILRMHGVQYDSYDVLSDETIRQGIIIWFCMFFHLQLQFRKNIISEVLFPLNQKSIKY